MNVIGHFSREFVAWGLLISLICAFAIVPIVEGLGAPRAMLNIFVAIALVINIAAVSSGPRLVKVTVAVALPMFVTNTIFAFTDDSNVTVLFLITSAVFFAYTAVLLIREIFLHQLVDTPVLVHSICVYVLMAVVFAMLHALVHLLVPGSYNFMNSTENVRGYMTDVIYFSIITLTTLGYGDSIPLSGTAKTLSSLQALFGQLYLTVIVARLVGLHISGNHLIHNKGE